MAASCSSGDTPHSAQLRVHEEMLQHQQIKVCCRLHDSVWWVYTYKSMVGNACPTAVHDMCILSAVLYARYLPVPQVFTHTIGKPKQHELR